MTRLLARVGQHLSAVNFLHGRPRRAAHAPRRLRCLRHALEPCARAGHRLPVKDYWEFDRLVTVSDPRGVADLDALNAIYHWTGTDPVQPGSRWSGRCTQRSAAPTARGITTLELRFNPMKRNRGGDRDLDHIILAAIRGLDRASIEYPAVHAGLILMMDRTFSAEQNTVIVEKAVRWAPRGIVGVDIAGTRPHGARSTTAKSRQWWRRREQRASA